MKAINSRKEHFFIQFHKLCHLSLILPVLWFLLFLYQSTSILKALILSTQNCLLGNARTSYFCPWLINISRMHYSIHIHDINNNKLGIFVTGIRAKIGYNFPPQNSTMWLYWSMQHKRCYLQCGFWSVQLATRLSLIGEPKLHLKYCNQVLSFL